MLERCRLALQEELDRTKSRAARNAMGQFATPPALALDILKYAKARCSVQGGLRFLDPAIGTGAFYSALRAVFPSSRISVAVGYEIDRHCAASASALWNGSGLELRQEDFTKANASPDRDAFDLLICNPPYVRHHHIPHGEKQRLKSRVRKVAGMDLSGLAGLYCYFLGLSHAWMAPDALAGWLIPSEFMDVNYGESVKRYLLDKVTLHHIHRFDPNDVQFDDALVSSALVWFRNKPPSKNCRVRLSFGGTLMRPRVERLALASEMRGRRKWTRHPNGDCPTDESPTLGEFFAIKRGLATGGNGFFILTEEQIRQRRLPQEMFRPILPGPRHLAEDEVRCDGQGQPALPRRLFVLDCRLAADVVKCSHPTLWDYLEEGKEQGVADRYICRHRTPWYMQERRPAAPFVCTYLGRTKDKGGPLFRFILNHSNATAANVYLMLYPTESVARRLEQAPALKAEVWRALNDISPEALLDEGRVYGGGLCKLEPKELSRVPATELARLFPNVRPVSGQDKLF